MSEQYSEADYMADAYGTDDNGNPLDENGDLWDGDDEGIFIE